MNYSNPFGSYPPSAVVDNILGESYHVVKTVYNSLGMLVQLAESDSLEFIKTNWEEMEPLISAGSAIQQVGENLDEILKSQDYSQEAKQYAEEAKKWANQLDTPVEGEDYSSKYWANKAQEVSGSLSAVLENIEEIQSSIDEVKPSIDFIKENMDDIQTTAENVGIINIIATDLKGELTGSEGISTDMGFVGDPETDQPEIAITGGNIKEVAENIGYVRKVADSLKDIQDVAGSLKDLPEIKEDLNSAVEQAEKAANTANQSIEQVKQYVSNAEDYQQYAKDWAIKTDGKVLDIDYSSKFYAQESKASAESAEQSASDANTFSNTAGEAANVASEASDTATQKAEDAKFYMQMAKMWAIKTDAPVEGQENSAKYYAYRARRDRLLAQDWAVKLDGLVDDTDYSAKYWALNAKDLAEQVAKDAEYVSEHTQVIIDNIEDINTVANNIEAVTAVGDNIQMVINVGADLVGDTTLDNILDYGVLGNDNPEVPVITGGNIHIVASNITTIDKLTQMIENGELDDVINSATVVTAALDKLQDVQDATEDFKNQAEKSKNDASNSAQLAKDWANKTDGTVDGEEYSAKYYAEQAKATVDTIEDTSKESVEAVQQAGQEQIDAVQNQGTESVQAVKDQEISSLQTIKEETPKQVQIIQAAGTLAEQTINQYVDTAKQYADYTKTQADKAGASAVESELSAKSSEDWSKLAKDWAVKMDDLVNNEDYSSKYWANEARKSYESTAQTLPDIDTAKQNAISSIQNEGTNQVSIVKQEGSDQVILVKQEGTNQTILVQEAGNKAIEQIQEQEESTIQNVVDVGTAQTNNAKAEADKAAQSASNALESETNAKASEEAAKASETASKASEEASKTAQTATEEARDAAKESETNALEYSNQASTSAQQAAESAVQAADSQINSDWTEEDEGSKAFIKNKPDLSVYALKTDLTTVFRYKGSVDTYNDLPTVDVQVGDTYNINEDGKNYTWNGGSWDDLGGVVDLTSYATIEYSNAHYLGITANAVSASKLQTGRDISLVGDAEGTINFDGTQAVEIETTVNESAHAVNADSSLKLTNARTISISGDATGNTSFDGTEDKDIALTLSNSGVTANTYGQTVNASPSAGGTFTVPNFTVDAKGRITNAADAVITLPNTITGNAGSATKLQTARTISISGDATGSGTFDGTSNLDIEAEVNHSATADKLVTARTISASGDASWSVSFDGSGNASATITLASSGATAGAYGPTAASTLAFGGSVNVPQVTVDAKGRVTAIVNRAITLPAAPTSVSGNAGTATKLATARTISIAGDATGSTTFDGSADKSITLTLASSGVTAGSYGPTAATTLAWGGSVNVPQLTVDAKGRVTAVVNRAIKLPAQITDYGMVGSS